MQKIREKSQQLKGKKFQFESICDFIFVHGRNNHESKCRSRHLFIPSDLLPQKHWMPQAGPVRLMIRQIHSPTHFTVRLLQQQSSTGWIPIPESNEFMTLQMEMAIFYQNIESHILAFDINVGLMCMVLIDSKPHRGLIIRRYEKE